MRKKWSMKPFVTCLLLGLAMSLSAQYRVTGGKGTPLLALEDSRYKLEVYLVYGVENLQISYTSSSTSHAWRRYETRALESESVSATQTGTTSTISNVQPGYGYFVDEGAVSNYIWIIDYSRFEFDIRSLSVADVGDPCVSFRLTGDTDMDLLIYHLPTNGLATLLNRSFDVTYQTLEWSDENQYFSIKEISQTITGNPFETSLEAPLRDTAIQLRGDHFARHFGVEKVISTEEYQAVSIEVYADTLMISTDFPNMSKDQEGYSAPTTVLFSAYANDPVASLYVWKIYKDDGLEDPNYLIRYTGEEVEYTFREYGTYIAEIEVSDRTGTCFATQTFEIQIAESALFIPNAFSPGTSPGVNDEFKVVYKSLTRFKAWIFNRWGNQLYHWTDPSQGWDGKYKGKYVVPGVYFYVIEAEGSDGRKYKKAGDINILRSKTIYDEIIETTE